MENDKYVLHVLPIVAVDSCFISSEYIEKGDYGRKVE